MNRRGFLSVLSAGVATVQMSARGQGRPLAPGDVRAPARPAAPPPPVRKPPSPNTDAGIHPGWPDLKSPASGYICKCEII